MRLDLPILMLGIMLGLILAAKKISSREERNAAQRSRVQSSGSFQPASSGFPSTLMYTPRTSPTFSRLSESVEGILRDAAREADIRQGNTRPHPHRQAEDEPVNSWSLIENWRKSIVGLIKLAESNLHTAKFQASVINHKAVAEAAATSVENISRALLHCYGEKPDLNSGQEEPLRLLARRFQGQEKVRFEKAIDEVVQLCRNRIVQACLAKRNIQAPLLTEARTKQIVETAVRIFTQFRQIIDEHFATEMPELREGCPNCHALNITLWAFSPQGSTHQCGVCGHKWIEPSQQTA